MADYKKNVPAPFLDELPSRTTDEIKGIVAQCAMEIDRLDQELKENVTVKELKENLKDLTGPFADTKKTLRSKIRYCRETLATRGI